MRSLVVLVAVAGCGRVGFGSSERLADASVPDLDAPADARICTAPIGHDEDGDLVDDACDVCPYVPDVGQADSDADGVGDACDLSAAAQRLLLFDPFTAPLNDWRYSSSVVVAGDTMYLPGVSDSIGSVLIVPPARDVFTTAGVVGVGGVGGRQVSLQIGQTVGAGHYYCELYDNGAAMALNFQYSYDGMTFNGVQNVAIPGRLENGAAEMTLIHDPPNMRCLATWKGVSYEASGAIPGGIAPDEFHIAVNNLDVTLDYFARISTP